MASQEDTDDLYADLYGGDGSGTGDVVDLGGEDKAHASDEQDLIGYDDDDNKDGNKTNDAGKEDVKDKAADNAASSGGSFIPPPSATEQQPQQFGAGLQIKGSSFIPPPSNTAHSNSDVRDLTPSNNNNNGGQQDDSQQQQGANEGNGHEGGDQSGERSVMPHEMPEEGKMFVGGLNWDTTEDSLRRYFSQFGEIGHCTIMRDNLTGRSRGFAFLNFVDPKAVNTVMVREHYLDGKVIDPKRAIPRPSHHTPGGGGGAGGGGGGGGGNFSGGGQQKLFVGGLPPSVTPESFRQFFSQYGTLLDCTCMMDRETGNPRGFGFLTYADDSVTHTVLNSQVIFDGKEVDVKRAQSKNDPQSLQQRRAQGDFGMGAGFQPRQQGNNRYGTGANNFNAGGNNFGGNNAGWGGMNPMMMGGGGFDPSAMAQMYQSMGYQNWNPQMAWQQMMASMAGQAGGGAAGAGGMDMSAMMGGAMGMGGMGMMGGTMGSMSPPNQMGSSMSPTMAAGSVNGGQRGSSSGPADDRAGSAAGSGRYQRGGSHNAGGSRLIPTGPSAGNDREGRQDQRGGGGYQRERSPSRGQGNAGRYDNANRNRY